MVGSPERENTYRHFDRAGQRMNRRTASGILVTAGSLIAAGVVGLPAAISGLSPVFRKREQEWRLVGPLEAFASGSVTPAAIAAKRTSWPKAQREQAVFVWRMANDEVVVFSRSCTDLGCPLDYDRRSSCYFCPCHGGIFDRDGSCLAGPPNAPMHRYRHRVREDLLEIDLTSIPPSA